MSTKICKECGKDKDYSCFHKMKDCVGGVRTVCKECRSVDAKAYNKTSKAIEWNKQYYRDHKGEIRERTRKHYWTLNGQYHQYKKRAKKAGMEFHLSEENCKNYYNTKCTYCGGDISGLGIDRLNNKEGYVEGNIVPCCSSCNFMKHIMNKEEFFDHLKKIYNHCKLTT